MSWDGIYWKYGSVYLKNHTITGSSYTSVSKEALKPLYAVGWASAFSLWYTESVASGTLNSLFGFPTRPTWRYSDLNWVEDIKTKSPCPSGFRLPTRLETKVYNSNGVPSSGWTWTASSHYNDKFNTYYWNGTTLRDRDFNEANYSVKCVK